LRGIAAGGAYGVVWGILRGRVELVGEKLEVQGGIMRGEFRDYDGG
jgi:hypothetical protein